MSNFAGKMRKAARRAADKTRCPKCGKPIVVYKKSPLDENVIFFACARGHAFKRASTAKDVEKPSDAT